VSDQEEKEKWEELTKKALQGDERCPIPIGARIEKINTEPGDTVQNGHLGYVRASLYVEPVETALYFVEWDGIEVPKEVDGSETFPYIAVGGPRIREVKI
jgi:hypothetical protein